MQRTKGGAYVIPEGGVLHRVLGSQGNAAEQNEEEDQVGEDRVVDDTVTLEAEPAQGGERAVRRDRGSSSWGLRSTSPPILALVCKRCLWFGGSPPAKISPPLVMRIHQHPHDAHHHGTGVVRGPFHTRQATIDLLEGSETPGNLTFHMLL